MVLAGFIVDRNRPNRKVLFIVAGVCALNVVGGWVYGRAGKLPQPTKRVAIVQGGVDITWIDSEVAARMVDAYWPLMGLIDGKADLIVWPESALPGDLLANPWLKSEISRFARDNRAYLLLGGYHDADDSEAEVGYREYNGAYLVSPDGKLTSKYYKVHLVPFGEFVPGRDWLPFINSYHIQDVDRSPGTGYNTMDAAFGRLGTMICFESTFPAIGREFASRGAGALVVLTNDSWFGKTAAAAQHHQFSVLRAVETRRYVVRAATTGISSVITPDGRVIRSVGLGKSAVIYGRIAMIKGETIFVRFGDWFVYLCMVIVVFGLFSKGQNTTGRSR
jgi:apolipoprotein N-acyltransferase